MLNYLSDIGVMRDQPSRLAYLSSGQALNALFSSAGDYMIRVALFAAIMAIFAKPSCATVVLVTTYSDFAQGNTVSGGPITDPALSPGALSTVQNGVTFSNINTGSNVRFFIDPTNTTETPSYVLGLNDTQFAIFAYGSFGFRFSSPSKIEDLYVNGVPYSLPSTSFNFLGFISDDMTAPTVATIQLGPPSGGFGYSLFAYNAFTAVPAATTPNTPIPEPASWAMLTGFSIVGILMRRRKQAVGWPKDAH